MPKIANSTPHNPGYCRHKASGQAVVTIQDRDFYLGPYGSKASKLEYDRLIGEWLTRGRPTSPQRPESLTVLELIAAYWSHAESYYRDPEGNPTCEVNNVRQALRPVKKLYGKTPAAEFGPLALKAVRHAMIEAGQARGTINRSIGRVRQMFRWAVENELVPPGLYEGLRAVAGLKAGRSEAKEAEPVKPVPVAYVEAVLPFVTPTVAAVIQLQLLTGCRSGEALKMRGSDLETSGDIWIYRPATHKNSWRGHERTIYLGPKAQSIIKPFLKLDTAAYLFNPADARESHLAERRANRKTPMTPSQAKRQRKAKPKRKPRDHYSVDTFGRAIAKAAKKAGIPHWHPHQLRHTRATELRKQYGVETARIILGHKSLGIVEVYAEADQARAVEVMRIVG